MHQFGAAAGRTFRKIILFEKRHAVTSGRGIDGTSQACGTAAYDDHVPNLAGLRHLLHLLISIHIENTPIIKRIC